MNKFFFTLVLVMLSTVMFAQRQVMNYSFLPPVQTIDEAGYSTFQVENCLSIGESNAPDVPYFSTNVLLPPGQEIQEVIISNVEYYSVIENVVMKPRAANFPISKGAPEGYAPVPDQRIYSVNAEYPEKIIDDNGITTSFLRGHSIGGLILCPVRYNPVEQTVRFVKNITVEVKFQSTPRAETALQLLRNDQTTTSRLSQLIKGDCSDLLHSYQSLTARDFEPNYDILIVTAAEFADALSNYIAHKQKMGYKTALKTVEDIYTEYEGVDKAEKVRNCIKSYYTNEGISYVMLVGDSHTSNESLSKIPVRQLYSTLDNPSVSDRLIASDLYFSCLDGNWNGNGNNNWGEPGDDCDLQHEVGVGRLCADNVTEIATFVEKLIKYESSPVVSDIKKVMLVGEQLDNSTYGGNAKDIVANGGTLYGMAMAPIPSDHALTRLYDRDGYWDTNTFCNQVNNNGTHLINHLGHCNVNYCMKFYNNDVTSQRIQNNGVTRGFFIVYSQGCYNGSFDNRNDNGGSTSYDCINEMFHKLSTGVIANIGNSRYGWYSSNNAGPSQLLDRTFFNAIFGKSIYNIGDVHADSKDVLSNYISSDVYLRWCAYELNLLGDPSMDIWTDTPTDFSPTYSDVISIAMTEFEVDTETPYARVALFQGSEMIGRAVCDENGQAIVHLDAINPSIQDIKMYITGHNKTGFEATIMVAEGTPISDLTATVNSLEVVLSWTPPVNKIPQEYEILRNDELIATISAANTTYTDVTNQENASFLYCVVAVYDTYELPSCIEVRTGSACAVIDKLEYYTSATSVQLTWTLTEISFPPDQIIITRNGSLLAIINEDIYTFTDNDAKEGQSYNYCIYMEHGACESDPVCIDITVTALNEANADKVSVFPNPASDKLTINGIPMQRIEIYNVAGQLLQTCNENGQSTVTLPLSHFGNGIYFLKIITEDKNIVKRFVIDN
jgi:hypothetical protein